MAELYFTTTLFDDFISSILTKTQPLPSGFDGMRAVKIINGLYESSQTGRKVTVYSSYEKELQRMILEQHG